MGFLSFFHSFSLCLFYESNDPKMLSITAKMQHFVKKPETFLSSLFGFIHLH